MKKAACVASIVVLAITGCSSAGDGSPDPSSGDDEVRTAECPATFELDLAKPEIYARTPTKYYDGSPLADADKARVTDAMTQAKKFKEQKLSFKLDKKARARCQYVSTMSAAQTAPHAELRGPSTKPVVDVTFGAFRYYAFPKSYSQAGFTFESGARAGVFAQIPRGDAPSLIVKIGNTSIASAIAPPSGDVGAAVAQLESEAVLPGPGRNDDYKVTGATPLDMVKSYIAAKYGDDTELRDGYTYKSNATDLEMDVQVAGTLTKDVATKRALESVKGWYSDENDADSKAHLAKVQAALDAIDRAGGTFGFDGFEQNGCAAPTAFLLVIDAKTKTVYGVDLNPCEE